MKRQQIVILHIRVLYKLKTSFRYKTTFLLIEVIVKGYNQKNKTNIHLAISHYQHFNVCLFLTRTNLSVYDDDNFLFLLILAVLCASIIQNER